MRPITKKIRQIQDQLNIAIAIEVAYFRQNIFIEMMANLSRSCTNLTLSTQEQKMRPINIIEKLNKNSNIFYQAPLYLDTEEKEISLMWKRLVKMKEMYFCSCSLMVDSASNEPDF